ncbi:unnamed protein product, partial [Prorocentrum cordatum]
DESESVKDESLPTSSAATKLGEAAHLLAILSGWKVKDMPWLSPWESKLKQAIADLTKVNKDLTSI